jgi:hypothetical protein
MTPLVCNGCYRCEWVRSAQGPRRSVYMADSSAKLVPAVQVLRRRHAEQEVDDRDRPGVTPEFESITPETA